MRPGGVFPAGLAGAGDEEELLADGEPEVLCPGEGSGDEDGDGTAPGCAAGGNGLTVLRPVSARPWFDAATAGACGAAHFANGAWGPPAIATTKAPRQTASAAADPRPMHRMIRRRRPDGSANTGSDCTSWSVAVQHPGDPEFLKRDGPGARVCIQPAPTARVRVTVRGRAAFSWAKPFFSHWPGRVVVWADTRPRAGQPAGLCSAIGCRQRRRMCCEKGQACRYSALWLAMSLRPC